MTTEPPTEAEPTVVRLGSGGTRLLALALAAALVTIAGFGWLGRGAGGPSPPAEFVASTPDNPDPTTGIASPPPPRENSPPLGPSPGLEAAVFRVTVTEANGSSWSIPLEPVKRSASGRFVASLGYPEEWYLNPPMLLLERESDSLALGLVRVSLGDPKTPGFPATLLTGQLSVFPPLGPGCRKRGPGFVRYTVQLETRPPDPLVVRVTAVAEPAEAARWPSVVACSRRP